MDQGPLRVGTLRWLTAAGGAILAATLGTVLVIQVTGGFACAAPDLSTTSRSGTATYYQLGNSGGNCSYVGPPADNLYVALGPSEYASGAACGGYVDVKGPRGAVRVKVVDQCPGCEPGHLDLSRTAFSRIANLSDGVTSISYQAVVNPPLSAPISVRVKEGSSQYWLAVLFIDHGNPLTAVAARTGQGAWRALHHTDYNYWLADAGLGPGPYALQISDSVGNQTVIEGVRLAPKTIQSTGVYLYGGPSASASPSPSPSALASASVPAGTPSVVAAAAVPSAASASPSSRRHDCG